MQYKRKHQDSRSRQIVIAMLVVLVAVLFIYAQWIFVLYCLGMMSVMC